MLVGNTSDLTKISISTDLSGPSEYFAVRLRGYLRRRSHTRKDKLYKVMLKQDMSELNGKLLQAFKDDKHVKRAKRGGKYALLTVPIATAIDKRQFLKYYCDKQYSAMQAIHTYIGKGLSSASQSFQLRVLDSQSFAQCR